MTRDSLYFDLKDLGDFNRALMRVEKVPQKVVTKAAGKGRTIVRKAIRQAAPVESGAMKRGIVSVGERSRYKGKKVYELMFDPDKNDVFQKDIKSPGAAGGKNKKAYYPASMEYGFLTRSKGGGLSYVPGYHFMRSAAEQSKHAAMKGMIITVTDELEKEWQK